MLGLAMYTFLTVCRLIMLIKSFCPVHLMQSRMRHASFKKRKLIHPLIASPDYAINNRLTPFVGMQNHYNLLYREEEREMMPTLKVRTTILPPYTQSSSALILFHSTLASVRSRGLRLPAVLLHTLSESVQSVPITTGGLHPFTETQMVPLTLPV